MSHKSECGCGSGGEDRIAWLDSRAAIRAAWVVAAVRGTLPPQDGLANNIHELRELSRHGKRAAGSVHTMDELRTWGGQKDNLAKHPLGRLSAEALEDFVSNVQFVDYVKDGQRYQHIGGFYYGDLLKHGIGYRGLFEVFAMFRMSAEYAMDSAGRRAAGKVGSHQCMDWVAWSCPFEHLAPDYE